MRPKLHMSLAAALLCTACAQLFEKQPESTAAWQRTSDTGTALSPAGVGSLLRQVAVLDEASAHREILRLRSGTAQGSAVDKLKLACLLSREYSGIDDLRRADALLEDLAHTLDNGDTREIVRLLQHNIRLQISLDGERSQVVELTRKIQRLKGLEKELRQHDLTTDPTKSMPAE